MKYQGLVVDENSKNAIFDAGNYTFSLTGIHDTIELLQKSGKLKCDLINLSLDDLNLIKDAMCFYSSLGNIGKDVKYIRDKIDSVWVYGTAKE